MHAPCTCKLNGCEIPCWRDPHGDRYIGRTEGHGQIFPGMRTKKLDLEGLDHIVGDRPFTDEDSRAISAYIQAEKAKAAAKRPAKRTRAAAKRPRPASARSKAVKGKKRTTA
mgnify:CR=1 FL=1